MVINKDLFRLLHELAEGESGQIMVNHSPVSVRLHDNHSKFSLSTPVYKGANYIPRSVRSCLTRNSPFSSSKFHTYLTLDETNLEIDLNYLGLISVTNSQSFQEILDEFSLIAHEWVIYLDKRDGDDLVRVRVK